MGGIYLFDVFEEVIMSNNNYIREFVKEKHKNHFRRDGVTPYFTHLERVAEKVIDDYYAQHSFQLKNQLEQTALLHDSLEDKKVTTIELMKLNLTSGVFEAVKLLTKDKYDDYLDYIRELKQNNIAKKVKIADILDNLSDNPTEKQIIKYSKALLILFGVEE